MSLEIGDHGDEMSPDQRNNDNVYLLKDNTHLQSYTDAVTSRRHTERSNDNIKVQPIQDSEYIQKSFGKLANSLEPVTKYISYLYNVILFNGIIVCALLIISRIFNNKLFHSPIFLSNSTPLLLFANITMMVSYSLSNYLALRVCLSIGCALFALWGLTNDPLLLDTFFFNFAMCLINLRHGILLLYKHRYILFEKEYEQIYCNIFKPYMKRTEFQKLINIGCIRKIKKNEIFKAKGDVITSLCCLVKGKITVLREIGDHIVSNSYSKSNYNLNDLLIDKNFVNVYGRNEFVEAMEWIYHNLRPSSSDRFDVSFIALKDSQYIKWPKEQLISLIDSDPNMLTALQAVLGQHTARSLLKSKEYQHIQKKMSTYTNSDEDRII